MTLFILACAGLVVLSTLFFYLPGRRRESRVQEHDANVEWYRLREQELAQEDEDLRTDARLRLLEDEAQLAESSVVSTKPDGGRLPRWLLVLAVALMSVGFYYFLGGARDVMLAQQLESLDNSSSPQDMAALIQNIEQRTRQRPDNLYYLSLLARYEMGQADYARALQLYEQMLELVPEDAQVLAYAAQAGYLAGDRELNDAARLRAEQALAADPHQPTALGLLGMASYEMGSYRAAINYWERLVAVQPPGSEQARTIQGVLARARQALGEPGGSPAGAAGTVDAAGDATGSPAADAGAGSLLVTVTAPAGASLAPTDTVFILARSAQSDSRMPVAVVRHTASELPLRVRLGDENSMAGQKLSSLESVVVNVQVSPSGQPGAANASWLAQSAPVTPGKGDIISLTLQPAAQPR